MRKVTQEEFDSSITDSTKWYLSDPMDNGMVKLTPSDDFASFAGVPLTLMRELEKLFETDKISVKTSFQEDLSEVTPGWGPEIWIEIRP